MASVSAIPESTSAPVGPTSLVDPRTGEVLALAKAPTDRLAAFLLHARDLEGELRAAKAAVSREVHRRMDAEASWTARVGDYQLTGQSPDRIDYDPDALEAALRRLSQEGAIAESAASAALSRVEILKPRRAGIKALLKLGGTVAEALSACERPVERERTVSV